MSLFCLQLVFLSRQKKTVIEKKRTQEKKDENKEYKFM